MSEVPQQICLIDILSEDCLIALCLHLGGPSAAALSSCCRNLLFATRGSEFLWRGLASALLGESLVYTHLHAWMKMHKGSISSSSDMISDYSFNSSSKVFYKIAHRRALICVYASTMMLGLMLQINNNNAVAS